MSSAFVVTQNNDNDQFYNSDDAFNNHPMISSSNLLLNRFGTSESLKTAY